MKLIIGFEKHLCCFHCADDDQKLPVRVIARHTMPRAPPRKGWNILRKNTFDLVDYQNDQNGDADMYL